jgi:tetratricopeptide (TPR) repeat protein/transcriptional regulator with XRE-family HTH domain
LFGQLLREHRLRAGWSQEDLSQRCGVSVHAISMLEAGRRGPRLSTVTRLASALALNDKDAGQLIAASRGGDDRAPGEPAVAAVPLQLPAGIRHFTGRLAELERLAGLAAQVSRATPAAGGTVVITAIDGMAGIGKTALAVHAAHHLADQFPDGQLFLDLHGYTQGYEPRAPADALAALLRALDVSAQRIPEDLEERAALYRQRLAGTRTLIVLDNAANEAQVRPLLPASAGCLVLITGRRRLKGLDDAYPLALDVLSPADALTLLHAVAGTQGGPADDLVLVEIAELCGRLPLALRIAAALLRHRPTWTPRHLADLLRDQNQRVTALADGDRDLGTVLGLSYASLADRQQTLFRFLGLTPGPDFDAYATAALTGTDPATATRRLEDLVDHNLLLQHVAGRYRLHDLLRVHARTLADHDATLDREAALDRLLDYYQHTANRADVLVTPYPRPAPEDPAPADQPPLPDQRAAWTWLRTERPNLLAGLRSGPTGHGSDRRTITLVQGLATLLVTDGPWADAMALHASASAAAQRLGDRSGRAYALFHQANIRLVTCDYPGAVRDVHEALALCQALGDRRGHANALAYLGYVRLMTGDYVGATAHLREALLMYRDAGERLGQINALIRLARVRISTGDHPGARRDLDEVLDICRDLKDQRGEAYALCNLADIKLLHHDYAGVAHDLQEAQRLFVDLDDHNGRAIVLGYLGQLGTLTGDYPAAIRYLEAAIDVHRRSGARGNEAWALNHYAAAVSATGDHERALSLYQTARQLSAQVQHPDDEAHALEGIGGHYVRAGDIESATAHLKEALDIFQHLAMTDDADRVQARLAGLIDSGPG